MLFEQSFWAGLADGSVTVTFRRWKRHQVVAGRRYRTSAPGVIVEVSAVDIVSAEEITEAEAVASGYPSAAALVADLRGSGDMAIYRIRFSKVDEPDPREELAVAGDLSVDDVEGIKVRLARLDARSTCGPWTMQTLALIRDQPAVRAADLAAQIGRETPPFKLDVRKLKNLGLTLSLEKGYRLSPRGEAFLAARL